VVSTTAPSQHSITSKEDGGSDAPGTRGARPMPGEGVQQWSAADVAVPARPAGGRGPTNRRKRLDGNG